MDFQLLPLPGTSWPPLPGPAGGVVWSAYKELDRTQWLPPEELVRMQLLQVSALTRHAFRNSVHYRDVLASCGIFDRPISSMEEYRRIPVLTRDEYRRDFKRLKCRIPSHMRVSPKPMFTSGTNGVPIPVFTTDYSEVWWTAMCMRDLQWGDIDPKKVIAGIRLIAMTREELPSAMAGTSAPFWTVAGTRVFASGPAYGMDVRQDPARQISWLRAVKPSYLISLPSNLEVLTGLLDSPLEGLEAVQTIGEPLTPRLRELISSAFGVRVVDLYSTTEAGYMASSCPEGHGLHVHSENILAEVLREDGTPCGPGETGRLVFTALHGYAVPFIRYDILDEVTLADGPCPCGRGLPLWTRVDGRRHPMLFLPDGRRKGSTGMMLEVRKVGDIRQFQVVQKTAEHFVVRVVPDSGWTDGHGARIVEAVRTEFGFPVRVDVERLESLERPNGKSRIVVVEPEAGHE